MGRPGLRIIPLGMFVLYVFTESGTRIKLHRDEVKRIYEAKGNPIREMDEAELLAAMAELGIEQREITSEDQGFSDTVEKKDTSMDDLKVLEELAMMLYKGFITEEEATLAATHGIALELTARAGHNITNGHVARVARVAGAKIIVNTDAHTPGDFIDQARAYRVALGAGLSSHEAETALVANAWKLASRVLGAAATRKD